MGLAPDLEKGEVLEVGFCQGKHLHIHFSSI